MTTQIDRKSVATRSFSLPHEVLDDPSLSLRQKREILCEWASDACAVDSMPALRWLPGTGMPVTLSAVIDALSYLDRRLAEKMDSYEPRGIVLPFKRHPGRARWHCARLRRSAMLSLRAFFRLSIAALMLLASAPASAAFQSYSCKDPILDDTAFHLWLDPDQLVVVWRSTPVSFVPSQLERTPLSVSGPSLSWTKDYLGDKLAFHFDRKSGMVTVTRTSNGRNEDYGAFACAPAENLPTPMIAAK